MFPTFASNLLKYMTQKAVRSGNGLLVLAAIVFLFSCATTRKTGGPHQYMTKQYIELKDVLNEAEVSIINDSVKVIFPNNVLFASSSDQLKEEVKPTFTRFADVLKKYEKTKILINGYTDNTGADDYNNELSQKRATNAKQLLLDNSVQNERMFIWGFGSRMPIAANSTEAGRAKNRRVEFVILYNVKHD